MYIFKLLRRQSQHLNNIAHLLMLIITSKEWISEMKFSNNTAKAPYIYFPIIPHTEDNLWCAIVSTLYIGVDCFVLKTARAEVYHANAGFIRLF